MKPKINVTFDDVFTDMDEIPYRVEDDIIAKKDIKRLKKKRLKKIIDKSLGK